MKDIYNVKPGSADLTALKISRRVAPMPPRKKFTQEMLARFPPGTFERIEAVLGPSEDRADLVRDAVERELRRREKLAADKPDG